MQPRYAGDPHVVELETSMDIIRKELWQLKFIQYMISNIASFHFKIPLVLTFTTKGTCIPTRLLYLHCTKMFYPGADQVGPNP